MSSSTILETIQDDRETELSRLGSSKALFALSDGNMEEEAILPVLAGKALASREQLEAYALESEGAIQKMFEGAGEELNHHFETILDIYECDPDPDDGEIYTVMATAADDATRLGGALGHAIVSATLLEQVVGFYVGNADPRTADTFRTLRDEARARRDEVLSHLERIDDGDIDSAIDMAERAIDAAYNDYVDALEAMGVNPKPVC